MKAIVPAYNEDGNIAKTVKALLALRDITGVTVVDDGSTDDTRSAAKKAGATVVGHCRRKGKGQALNTALVGREAAAPVVLVDADLGEQAKEMGRLTEPVRAGACDLAIAKFSRREEDRKGLGAVKFWAHLAVRRFGGGTVEEPLSGQRCLNRRALELLLPFAEGWAVEVAMTVEALKKGLRVLEIETDLRPQTRGSHIADYFHRGGQFWDLLGLTTHYLQMSVRS